MKQIIAKVTMLLAVLIMSAKAFAYDFEVDGIYDFEVDGIYYNVLSDTTCEVTKRKFELRIRWRYHYTRTSNIQAKDDASYGNWRCRI